MVDAINTAVRGLHQATRSVAQSASSIANPNNHDDLAKDIIDIKSSETAYKANIAVIKVASQMEDELLRLFDKHV